MKRIRNLMKNIKLRERIFINFTLLCIIPLAIISILNYSVSVSNTKEVLTDFINLFSSQLNSEIEGYVSSIDNISKTVLNDGSILNFLSSEKGLLMSERVSDRTIIYNYINNMELQKPDVHEILIVGASGSFFTNNSSEQRTSLAELEAEPWYQKLINSNGNLIITPIDNVDAQKETNASTIFIIGRVLKDVYGKRHGVIAFKVELKDILDTNIMQNHIITDNEIGIEVMNGNGEYIYNAPSKLIRDMQGNIRDKAIILSSQSSHYGLTITVVVPKDKLFNRIYSFRNFSIAFIIVVFLVSAMLSLVLSHTITMPLSKLSKSMQEYQHSNFIDINEPSRRDEIGMLTEAYNQMISKINTLINDVYAAKLKERQAQFVALQNQINPHMFYNTIENIRMRAVLNNDPEVSEMIKDLGKIFQLTLAKGKVNHTIRDEIDYIVTYMNLLNVRHGNRYKLEINIPDEIMEACVIRFIFQPVVENSINHGFRNRIENCVISIASELHEDGILLKIVDNGAGIAPEKIAAIKQAFAGPPDPLSDGRPGIGLLNVYERIKLEYGERYYLDIRSEYGAGTTVEILIPYRKAQC